MIKDDKKTKRQLIDELSVLRQKVVEAEGYQRRRSEFGHVIRMMIDSSPVPIIVIDKQQKTNLLSGKFEETFGYDREEIPTLYDWWRIAYPNKANGNGIINEWRESVARAIDEGNPIDPIETAVICKDGSKRYIEFRFIPVRDNFIVFCHDLTDAKRTEAELAQANEKLKVWICELELQNSRMNLLRRMGEDLHACRNVEDASPVIKHYGPQLFPRTNGSLYTLDGKYMSAVVKWGNYSNEDILIDPKDCKALQAGKPFEKKEGADKDDEAASNGCICGTDHWFGTTKSVCIPMKAAGEAQGLLHLGLHDDDDAYERGLKELAMVLTEHLALALANLKLQDTLRAQAVRDPLTGLFNRRYMEESLDREFHRAARQRRPVSVVMADIDHFKLFNDTHGHDAGDALLKQVSDIMQKSVRREDIVCRFGGEEFILIMPDMPLDIAVQRAGYLREEIKARRLHYEDSDMGSVSISLGVAAYPDHGNDARIIMKKADDALYKAKKKGRNCVEVS